MADQLYNDPHNVILRWQRAYKACNEKSAPAVTYRNGWYRIHGLTLAMRRNQISEATKNLWVRASTTQGK